MLEALVSAGAALLGAAAGAIATYKAAGPYWERVKLSAEPALIEARLRLYGPLWDKTDYGTPEAPKDLSEEEKNKLLEDLRTWYYKDGAGLLLSDAARVQWSVVTDLLKRPPSPAGIGAGIGQCKNFGRRPFATQCLACVPASSKTSTYMVPASMRVIAKISRAGKSRQAAATPSHSPWLLNVV
jgi:hypothetical protein